MANDQHVDFTNVQKNLTALGYRVSCFDTAKDAVDYLDASIDGETVGFGGSVTLDQMGLYERLCSHNDVSWHWRIPQGGTADAVYARSASASIYISSVNGLAETGEIVNIDNNGNRVAAIQYGHKKVILIAGENKLAATYEKALARARNIAAPLNAQRLKRKTPCAVKADRCYDCKSPERICRGLSVLWSCPASSIYEVVLVHESLGY